MQVVYTHCCGLDVHKKTITACLLISGLSGKGSQDRRFGTMIRDRRHADQVKRSVLKRLERLGVGVTIQSMESTTVLPT